MIRSGIGYDIHRFADGLKLILGGVEIAHARGLEGHSDADVLSHAIADALLGAIGAGDIGQHFPNTDESIRGISSMEILKRVGNLLAEKNARVVNVDATVIAEAPKLAAHGPAMRQKIAAAIGVSESDVSVKATTNEKLGPIGQGEGIAAIAIATVEMERLLTSIALAVQVNRRYRTAHAFASLIPTRAKLRNSSHAIRRRVQSECTRAGRLFTAGRTLEISAPTSSKICFNGTWNCAATRCIA